MLEHVPATREARELPAIEAAIEPHVERIQAAAADAFAPNTRRAYRTAPSLRSIWPGRRSVPPTSRRGRRTRPPRKASGASSGASRVSGRGRGGVRRPRSPPKRWPRSAPRPPLPARVPPDGRNPPKLPGSGEPWTWRSPRSCGTPCSGAPKRPRSNGLMSSSGRMDRDGSRSAARRPTRKGREPSSTSGRGPPLLSGRSAPRTRMRTPACSASAPDAPWPAASPPWQGPLGSKARPPDTPPASGWPAISWPPGPPSPPSRLRAGGLPSGCPPTMLGASWPRAEPSPGSTGSEGPRPSGRRREAVGSPLTAFGAPSPPRNGRWPLARIFPHEMFSRPAPSRVTRGASESGSNPADPAQTP